MAINQAILQSIPRDELVRNHQEWLLDEYSYHIIKYLFSVMHTEGTKASLSELEKFKPLEEWEKTKPI